LILSALMSMFGETFAEFLPGGVSSLLLQAANAAASFAIFTVLFAAMYRFLPDARIAWRQVWVGAAFTTLLFVAGKSLIGLYLGNTNPGQAYGAASSLAVLLVWIYYSSMIMLFGAEFTEVWNRERGHRIVPEAGAILVDESAEPGRAAAG